MPTLDGRRSGKAIEPCMEKRKKLLTTILGFFACEGQGCQKSPLLGVTSFAGEGFSLTTRTLTISFYFQENQSKKTGVVKEMNRAPLLWVINEKWTPSNRISLSAQI